MITLICTLEPARIGWLPQFVQHYRALGVERFLLTLQLEPAGPALEQDRHRAEFRETLADLGIGTAFVWVHTWDGPSMAADQRSLARAHVASSDWVVWCDLDEFQVYPEPLRDIVARCEADDVDYIRGIFIDRVAEDGGLPRFDPRRSIWDTFPRTCNVTRVLAQANPHKVILAKGSVLVYGGKHAVMDGQYLKPLEGWGQVHHFKWDASVLERLRYRLSPDWKAKCPWWTESQRLLDYFEANGERFNLADLPRFHLPGPHFLKSPLAAGWGFQSASLWAGVAGSPPMDLEWGR